MGVQALTLWTCEAPVFASKCRQIAQRYHKEQL
jgi:hypothetical protein